MTHSVGEACLPLSTHNGLRTTQHSALSTHYNSTHLLDPVRDEWLDVVIALLRQQASVLACVAWRSGIGVL